MLLMEERRGGIGEGSSGDKNGGTLVGNFSLHTRQGIRAARLQPTRNIAVKI